MQRGQNSRTAGAVSYGVGFFGLVNIMQPQNCTTRLRRLVWTSFFLCVVFLFHFVWFFFFFMIFHHVGGVDRKRSAFFLLHLNTTKLFLCVCQVHFFGWWFVFCFFFCKFSFWRLCRPPSRKTYYDTILCDYSTIGLRAEFEEGYLDTCRVRLRRRTCGHDIIGARLHRIGALRRGYKFSTCCFSTHNVG